MEYKQIVDNCRNGEREAQMRFYDLFHRTIYGSSLRIVGNEFEAEEVMQETILKVLTRPAMLRDCQMEMLAVLKRIAINHSIDLYRKKRKWDFVELNRKHEFELQEEVPVELPENFSFALVREILERMSDNFRVILSLRLIEGMGFREIAGQLGMDDGVARVIYSRARKKLSEEVKKTIRL